MDVESTARQAFEHGYNVTIAADAVTDLNAEAHARSLEWIFPMLGELGTADALLPCCHQMAGWRPHRFGLEPPIFIGREPTKRIDFSP
jgi:isochorismate hydrolase